MYTIWLFTLQSICEIDFTKKYFANTCIALYCSFIYLFLVFFSFAFFLELFAFTCPKVDEGTAATHPRYADPEDCQFVTKIVYLLCFSFVAAVAYEFLMLKCILYSSMYV